MSDVFVSYSRRDQEFVRRLHAALSERGKDAWVDWEDIPATAKWQDELNDGIVSADSFLFVLTPSSLSASRWKWTPDMPPESSTPRGDFTRRA